jgi:hypothetical protein
MLACLDNNTSNILTITVIRGGKYSTMIVRERTYTKEVPVKVAANPSKSRQDQ